MEADFPIGMVLLNILVSIRVCKISGGIEQKGKGLMDLANRVVIVGWGFGGGGVCKGTKW